MRREYDEFDKLNTLLTEKLTNPFYTIDEIYEPDGNLFMGESHSAIVHLISPDIPFRIWFSFEEEKIKIKNIERWFFSTRHELKKVTETDKLNSLLSCEIKSMFYEIHAIYEPDGNHPHGDCYMAGVDLFSWMHTFKIYFKKEDGRIEIIDIERWFLG